MNIFLSSFKNLKSKNLINNNSFLFTNNPLYKNFTYVKKYITPKYKQDYYDNKVFKSHKNRLSYVNNREGKIAPSKPLHPDEALSLDNFEEKDNFVTYNDFYKSVNKDYYNKVKEQSVLAGQMIKENHSPFSLGDLDELFTKREIYSKQEVYEVYRQSIRSQLKIDLFNKNKDSDLESQLHNIVKKLDYLDYREFLALNKYILESNDQHEDFIDKTKKAILSATIELIDYNTNKDLIKKFRDLERKAKESDDPNVKRALNNQQLEFVFENIHKSEEFFYHYYNLLKEQNNIEEIKATSQFDKIKEIEKLKKKKNKTQQDYEFLYDNENLMSKEDPILDKFAFNYDNQIDRLLRTYRSQRLKRVKFESDQVFKRVEKMLIDNFNRDDTLPHPTFKGKEEEIENPLETVDLYWKVADAKEKDDLILLIKYFVIYEKLKTGMYYEPTNVHNERKIYNYLKSKLISTQINEEDIGNTNIDTDHDLFDNDESSIFENNPHFKSIYNKIKDNYNNSKNNLEKENLLKDFDNAYAKQFGHNIANKAEYTSISGKEIKKELEINEVLRIEEIKTFDEFQEKKGLIERIVDNYYRDNKIEHMYNYMDYFNHKYRVKSKINDLTNEKVSIKEINHLITKLAYNTIEKNNNISNNDKNILNNNETKDSINVLKSMQFDLHEHLSKDDNAIEPDFMKEIIEDRTITEKQKQQMENYKAIITHDNNLSHYDKYEMEIYKGIKRTPFFRHNLHTNIAFSSERMNSHHDFMNKIKKINYNKDDIVSYSKTNLKITQLKNHIVNENPLVNLLDSKDTDIILNNSNDSNLNVNDENNNEIDNLNTTNTNKDNFEVFGKGKRKSSVATVRITPGKGEVLINYRPINDYFLDYSIRNKILKPLQLSGLLSQVDIFCDVFGGGSTGQTEAIVTATSRALLKLDKSLEEDMTKELYLQQDNRKMERKKPGLQGARKGQVYLRR